MKTVTYEKIEEFLKNLSTDVDVLSYVDIDRIDFNNAYYSIFEMIDDNGGFNIEIIYYTQAIEYLKENDPSLNESLELAYDIGFSLKNINSEILASLLASENARESFYKLKTEINDFFEELEEEL